MFKSAVAVALGLGAAGLALSSTFLPIVPEVREAPTGVADNEPALDLSGRGSWGFIGDSRDGAIRGATAVPGRYGNALSFDGVDDYVAIEDSPVLDFRDGFAITFWVKFDGDDAGGTVLGKLRSQSRAQVNEPYRLVLDPKKVSLALACRSGRFFYENDSLHIPRGQWTHVMVAWDAQRGGRIYVNGSAEPELLINPNKVEFPCSLVPTPDDLWIGSRAAAAGGGFFRGHLDELRLYSVVLEPGEVQEDMNSAYPVRQAVATLSFEGLVAGTAHDTGHVVRGRFGPGVGFDGKGHVRVQAPASSILDRGGDKTVVAWVRPSNAAEDGSWHYFLSRAGEEWSFALGYEGVNGAVAFRVWNHNLDVYELIGGEALGAGEWHHVAGVRAGCVVALYINGELAASRSDFIGDVRGGSMPLEAGKDFRGEMDEIGMWNRALAAEEIGALYLGQAASPRAVVLFLPFGDERGKSPDGSTEAGVEGTTPVGQWRLSFDAPRPEVEVSWLQVYNDELYATTTGSGRAYKLDDSRWTLAFQSSDAQLFAMAVYRGKLYVGSWAGPGVDNAKVYVFDGSRWALALNTDQPVIRSMAAYGDRLYVGATGAQGKIYSYDGSQWSLAYTLSNPAEMSPQAMAVYGGKLYVGGEYSGKVWTYDGNVWTEPGDDDYPGGSYGGITSFAIYEGDLYASAGGYSAGQRGSVLRFDGAQWSQVLESDLPIIHCLAVYGGKLYASAGNHPGNPGAKVYVYDGTDWKTSFKEEKEDWVFPLATHHGKLYAGTLGDALIYEYREPAAVAP